MQCPPNNNYNRSQQFCNENWWVSMQSSIEFHIVVHSSKMYNGKNNNAAQMTVPHAKWLLLQLFLSFFTSVRKKRHEMSEKENLCIFLVCEPVNVRPCVCSMFVFYTCVAMCASSCTCETHYVANISSNSCLKYINVCLSERNIQTLDARWEYILYKSFR